MNASALIRTVDCIETPAPGRWVVAANQPVHGRHRHVARCVDGRGRTLGGALVIADEGPSWIELSIEPGDLPLPASGVRYRTTTLTPTREGIWLLDGVLTAGAVARPLRSIARYHGVYRHGDRAAAWFTLHARVDVTDYVSHRLLGGRRLDLTADLTADAPGVS